MRLDRNEIFWLKESKNSLKDWSLGRIHLQILETNLNQETWMPLKFSHPLSCLHPSAYTITIIITTAMPATLTSSNEHLYSVYCAHIHELST